MDHEARIAALVGTEGDRLLLLEQLQRLTTLKEPTPA